MTQPPRARQAERVNKKNWRDASGHGRLDRIGDDRKGDGMSEAQRVKVWDGATRLFHWLLVFLIGLSWLSVRKGWMGWHMWSGYLIGALLLFRIAWGFVGSETSRFSHFLASPFEAVRHLLHLTRREPDEQVGHNAAGGWMVLAMLALVSAQVITGLCANDDVTIEAPLVKYVGKEMSDTLTGLHYRIFTLIQIAVVAHIGAIAAYFILKRHNLLHPMLHGHKHLPIDTDAPHIAHPLLAWAIFLVAATIMYVVATRL
jgi:cytochrome b